MELHSYRNYPVYLFIQWWGLISLWSQCDVIKKEYL